MQGLEGEPPNKIGSRNRHRSVSFGKHVNLLVSVIKRLEVDIFCPRRRIFHFFRVRFQTHPMLVGGPDFTRALAERLRGRRPDKKEQTARKFALPDRPFTLPLPLPAAASAARLEKI